METEKIILEIPTYSQEKGLDFGFCWEDNFSIFVEKNEKETTIKANKEGLVSLAKIFLALSEAEKHCHIHLDQHNSLEENSVELIIETSA